MTHPIRRFRALLKHRYGQPPVMTQEERTRLVIRLRKAIIGVYVWMFALSVVLVLVTVSVVNSNQSTATRARAACERTKILAPAIGAAYTRYHILSPPLLDLYRSTIPKSC